MQWGNLPLRRSRERLKLCLKAEEREEVFLVEEDREPETERMPSLVGSVFPDSLH